MKLTLSADMKGVDGDDGGRSIQIPAGTHEVEKIPNPLSRGNEGEWLVLKGTKQGGDIRYWEGLKGNGVQIVD